MLAGLEVFLYILEEVLISASNSGRTSSASEPRPGRIVVRHAQDLSSRPASSCISRMPTGRHGTDSRGNVATATEQQRVERIAVIPERLQQEP